MIKLFYRYHAVNNCAPYKKSDTDKQNTKLIALILLEKDNFNDGSHAEIAFLAQNCFRNDPELTEWLDEIRDLLHVIVDFAEQQDSLKDLLDGAYRNFINSCPLVSEETKNEYLQAARQLQIFTNTNPKGFSSVRRSENPKIQAFINYLAEKMYSPNTCNAYKYIISKLGSEILEKNLWSINDPAEMQKRLDAYSETPKFIQKNDKTNKTLSNGLKRYIEFLRETAK